MTDRIDTSDDFGLTKLSGRIQGYKRRREAASFVFSDADQNKMGAIAVAASLVGLGGAAVATAANATNVEEEADFVEFSLDGMPVKGWVWRSPFNEGDEVEVAGEMHHDFVEVFGIARPADRTVALYPHCSRGSARHMKNAFKWWLWLGCGIPILMYALVMFYVGGLEAVSDIYFIGGCAALMAFTAAMFVSLARKWLPFVRLSEKVFRTLGWPDPGNVDLVRSSATRRKTDSDEFGTFYFRY